MKTTISKKIKVKHLIGGGLLALLTLSLLGVGYASWALTKDEVASISELGGSFGEVVYQSDYITISPLLEKVKYNEHGFDYDGKVDETTGSVTFAIALNVTSINSGNYFSSTSETVDGASYDRKFILGLKFNYVDDYLDSLWEYATISADNSTILSSVSSTLSSGTYAFSNANTNTAESFGSIISFYINSTSISTSTGTAQLATFYYKTYFSLNSGVSFTEIYNKFESADKNLAIPVEAYINE